MKFSRTPLEGLVVIDLEVRADARGSFARAYCDDEFAAQGLNTDWPQLNLSRNTAKGTVRGMHYQADPHGEVKVVRCVRGSILDVAVDVREGSPTRGQWHAVELSAANGRAFYIPTGFAHGFQALEDDCELLYLMSTKYVRGMERGIRWNDPKVNVRWPLPVVNVAAKDDAWPSLSSLL